MKERPCIRIGHLKIVDHLLLGLTTLQLKNKESHLDHCTIDPLVMNSWDQISEALTNKEIDGALMTAPLAMDLFASGLDIRLLMFTHRSGSMIVKKTGANIKTIADFKGKTVLIPSELSIQNMLLHRLLSTATLNLGSHDDHNADVTWEVVNPYLMSEMLASDTDNDIAGFAAEEPYGSEAILNGIAQKVCTSDNLWNNHPCCSFVVNASVLEDNATAITELIDLFVQTAKSLKHPINDNILANAQTFLCQKKQVVQNILMNHSMKFDPTLLIPDIEALETIANYMKDSMGILSKKVDIKKLVADTFILNSIPDNSH